MDWTEVLQGRMVENLRRFERRGMALEGRRQAAVAHYEQQVFAWR